MMPYDPYKTDFYGLADPNLYTRNPMPPWIMPHYGYVRLLHASPDAPPVDVYVDGYKIASHVTYGKPVNYIGVPVGRRKFTAYAAGTKKQPVLTGEVNVLQNMYFTLAAIGDLKNIKPLLVLDNLRPTLPNRAQARAIHLSFDAPSVDVTLDDGKLLFDNIKFGEITSYVPLAPATYTFKVRLAGKPDTVVLTVPNQNLKPRRNYSLYIIGEAGKKTLQMLVLPDGRVIR